MNAETLSMVAMAQKPPRMKSNCGLNLRSWLTTQAMRRNGYTAATDNFTIFVFVSNN